LAFHFSVWWLPAGKRSTPSRNSWRRPIEKRSRPGQDTPRHEVKP
jgi:hypothetical protein